MVLELRDKLDAFGIPADNRKPRPRPVEEDVILSTGFNLGYQTSHGGKRALGEAGRCFRAEVFDSLFRKAMSALAKISTHGKSTIEICQSSIKLAVVLCDTGPISQSLFLAHHAGTASGRTQKQQQQYITSSRDQDRPNLAAENKKTKYSQTKLRKLGP